MTGPRTLAVDYDVYEIAYLAGGPCRAVDAAVVALAESGRIAVDRSTGQLSVADGRHRHWLEAAAMDGIKHRGHRTPNTLRWRLRSDPRFADVRHRLERDGLLRRSVPSASRHRSWTSLALTGQGRRTLRHLRAEPPIDRVAEGTRALPVALCGLGAMSDPSLRAVLFHPPAPPRPPKGRDLRPDPYVVGFGSYTYAAPVWVAGSEAVAWGGDGGGGGSGDGGGGG
ncbi:TIGR04222 domain-containing membrane protein [Candidatus Blastococcus massiliensis]|uniref:TIGR04222 domain-containing membrane protein n=1 Tax=Candidatus Blastococcus massiliensis TaxID=1470358 RepID=UPI001412D6CB|nr:TIGR04222 domain-containing membrane protein [Candidatus Blastococcus massiliensis]